MMIVFKNMLSKSQSTFLIFNSINVSLRIRMMSYCLDKNLDDALIREFVANLTLRLLLDPRQLLPPCTSPSSFPIHPIFPFLTPALEHFTFFASTFCFFRLNFSILLLPSAPFLRSAFFMWRVWPGCSICVVNYEKAKSHSSNSLPPSPYPSLT